MRDILFFTQRVQMGFGVGVLVDSLARELVAMGYNVGVACWESDMKKPPYKIFIIDSSLKACLAAAKKMKNPIVVANTSPFFEMLPEMKKKKYECWAYEAGDPTPELFAHDAKERSKIIAYKKKKVYHHLDGVISISNFIRYDISYPQSSVVYCGCDHIPDRGTKTFEEFRMGKNRKMRVGTLMRLGVGEAFYKGNQIFVDIVKELQPKGDFEFLVMGRGTKKDASLFEEQGVQVILNGTEAEKWAYLRSLDVFVTCSLWEGCNLPLIEAQALGTVGLAFDVGAHPEVTPLIASNTKEVVAMIGGYAANTQALEHASRQSYYSVRDEFTWKKAAEAFLKNVL